jgi:tetratricopeptide (TPR) repeat protein
LTAAAIGYEPAGVHRLKGKAEPVALYRATAVMDVVGGEGRAAGVEAPLVGRRRELGLLKDLFQATAEDGGGRLLVVAGAPGFGKTRLGWELQKFTDGLSADVWWHWGRCPAYGDGVAYSALAAAVRRRIGADDDAPAAEQRARLQASLEEMVPDLDERAWLEPRLGVLLGGEDSYTHEDLFAAWLTWFQLVSHGGEPVVWVIDDAHDADDGLLDFVEHLVGAARFPMLVVLLARPELLVRRPRLAVSRRGTVISLEGLDERAMGELFDALVVDLPPRVHADLVHGSEGVPLYAVETVRAMLDRGLLVEEDGRRRLAPGVDAARLADIGAPTSLLMLIASRLDALPATLRELVQYASVLGDSFSLEGLTAVSGRTSTEVAEAVGELAGRDLISRVVDRFSPDFGRYAFVQALVRQVAYRTQSRAARLTRHLAAARYLETQSESSGEVVAVVAQHLGDALGLLPAEDPRVPALTDELVAWLERSGQRATSLGAAEEALCFYTQALGHVRDGAVRARLAVLAARAALDAGHTDRGLALASDVHDDDPLDLRARAAAVRGDALRRLGRPSEAQKEFRPFLDAVDELPDGTAVSLLRLSSRAYAEVGDASGGRPLVEEALRRAERAGDPMLIGWALNDLAAHFFFAGLRRVGVAVLDTALPFCETHHATAPLLTVLINRGLGSVQHDLREALHYYRRALETSRSTGDSWTAVLASHSLLMVSTIAGSNDAAALADVAWLCEPVLEEMPVYRALQNALDTLRSRVRGTQPTEPLAPVDESQLAEAPRDLGQEVAVIRLVHAREAGTLPAIAAHLATGAVTEHDENGGTVEWYPFLWSTSVDWLLESGTGEDLAAARASVALVERAGGRYSPAVAAELPRLRAALTLADPTTPVDPAAVERDLRESITALEAYGAVPDRARAQLLLGRWLADRGRAAEATAVLAEARSTFAELGMPGAAADADTALASLPRSA